MAKKYTAFISYKHHPLDSAIAASVQRRLENYRVPRRIAEKLGRKQIGQIFRDKEELPISSDINDDIEEAIRGADYLIVICSPRSKEAVWVNREIKLFLENHDRNHILAVLAEGEPYEAFPEILTYEELTDPLTGEVTRSPREPLAADMRNPGPCAGRSAQKDELTRLAAAILGVGFDELKQRRRQQERKRRATVLGICAAVVLVFLAYMIRSNLLISRANKLLEESYEQVNENYNNALENQSRYLASASREQADSYERFMALELALAALPGSDDPDRPLVSSAVSALNYAAGFYDLSSDLKTIGSFSMGKPVRYMEFTSDAGLLAACDTAGGISVFNTGTVRTVWSRNAGLGSAETFRVLNDSTIVYVGYEGTACYELETGAELWRLNEGATGAVFNESGSYLLLTGTYDISAGAELSVIDTATGSKAFTIPVPDEYVEGTGSYRSISIKECSGTVSDPTGRYLLCCILKEYGIYRPLIIDTVEKRSAILPEDCKDIYSALFGAGNELYFIMQEAGTGESDPYSTGSYGSYYTRGLKQCAAYDLNEASNLWKTELEHYSWISSTALYHAEESGRLICILANRCCTINPENGRIEAYGEGSETIVFSRLQKPNGQSTFFTPSGKQGIYKPDTGEIYLYSNLNFEETLDLISYRSGTYAFSTGSENGVYLFSTTNRQARERYEEFDDQLEFRMDSEDILIGDRYVVMPGYETQLACLDAAEKRLTFSLKLSDHGLSQSELLGFSKDNNAVWLIARSSDDLSFRFVKVLLEDGSVEAFESSVALGFSCSPVMDSGIMYFCDTGDGLLYEYDPETAEYEAFDIIADTDSADIYHSVYRACGSKLVLIRYDRSIGYEPTNYLLFDTATRTSVTLCEVKRSNLSYYASSVFISENGSMLACSAPECIMLYDSNGNELGSVPVPGSELRCMAISPDGTELILLRSNYLIDRYSTDGSYIGPVPHCTLSAGASYCRWEWKENELWMWCNNRLLNVIDTTQGAGLFSVDNCLTCVQSPSGDSEMVCYSRLTDELYGLGCFRRLSLDEQIAAARELLAEYSMPMEYKEFYGLG